MNAVHRTILGTIALTVFARPLFAQTNLTESSTVTTLSPAAPEVSASSELTPVTDFSALIEQLQPTGPPPTPRHTGIKAMFKGLGTDFKHLPSMTNLYWVAGGGALSLAVHPWDDDVQRQVTGNDTADNLLKPGRIIGNSGTLFGLAATTYAFGRLRDQPKVSHTGMDLLRAITISQALVRPLKYATRRERPDDTGKTSFPSGHAADTFAVATALERHLGWRYSIPGYLFASYVAASRLPSSRHWMSDITFGATIGIIAGRTVSRPGRPIRVTPVSVPGGMAILYQRRW